MFYNITLEIYASFQEFIQDFAFEGCPRSNGPVWGGEYFFIGEIKSFAFFQTRKFSKNVKKSMKLYQFLKILRKFCYFLKIVSKFSRKFTEKCRKISKFFLKFLRKFR